MGESQPMEMFGDAQAQVDNALVLVAFPTTGSSSSIAAQYMVRHLGLPLVGHLRLPELAGLIAVQDGRATSPVRVYGGEVACKVGHDCPRVFIVTTELALPPPVLMRAGEAIMAWAAAGGAHMILVLEGVVRAEGDDTPDVFCASAEPQVVEMLRRLKVPRMERAVLAGICAQILLDGPRRGVRSGTILVEASREHPDGRAAAALIEAVGRLIPEVPVDAKPLLAEAMALEAEIGKARQAAMANEQPAPPQSFI